MLYRYITWFSILLILAFGLVLGCEDDDDEGNGHEEDTSYNPVIDPADFSSTIDNPYFPLVVGTITVFEGQTEEALEHIEVEVLDEIKTVMGVECRVVRDRVWEDNELVEDTYDWYSQDSDGNVWYFGEESYEIEDGEIESTEGSWEAGVDGAKPGIQMLANPIAWMTYKQEYYYDEAEDMARILDTDRTVTIGLGTYEHCLMIEEWTPLEPDVREYKYYAPGIGVIREEIIEGGSGTIDMIQITNP